MAPFVPDEFVPPTGLDAADFRLCPLGPEYNESDYAAWTVGVDHIRRTPGFEGLGWPHPMTRAENFGDLVRHADDFAARRGFTYTVLEPDADVVIGCVYIYPAEAAGFDAQCRSWVRADLAHLDPVLYHAVRSWLVEAWPFERVDYAGREEAAAMAYVRDPRVDAYIDALPDWQQGICARVRDLVHGADSEVAETIKRTVQPYFVLNGNICALLAAKDHVNVFLYDGGIVPDPEGIVTAGHDNTTARTVAFRRGEAINEPALSAMFRQIIANNRAGGWRKLKGG
jgi:hypothetical protein